MVVKVQTVMSCGVDFKCLEALSFCSAFYLVRLLRMIEPHGVKGVNRVGSFSSVFRRRRAGHTEVRLVPRGMQPSQVDARVTMFCTSGSEYVQETQDSPGPSECFHKMKTNSILRLRNYPHCSPPTRKEVCGILGSHHCYASMGGIPCLHAKLVDRNTAIWKNV